MTMQLSKGQIQEFQRNGAIKVAGAIGSDWVDRMLAVVDAQLSAPSAWANDGNQGAKQDRMFTDRYQWKDNPEIGAYIRQAPLAHLAAQVMQSDTARFYFDHVIVKEPSTAAPTPWHQDVPYWPFMGKQICSIWVALTETTVAESAMEFVAGSHLDGIYYKPEVFLESDDNPNAKWQETGAGAVVPNIEANRDKFDIIGWDVSPGDAIVFSAWILHWAPGNASASKRRAAISTRWLGDDVVWHPHVGADPTVQQSDVAIQPGQAPIDEENFPLIWSA